MAFGQELIIRTQDGTEERFVLEQAVVRVGRADGNDIVLRDGAVSRRHAQITLDERGATVEDLDSGNGLKVGEKTVRSVLLRHGDAVGIGPFTLEFRVRDDVVVHREEAEADAVGFERDVLQARLVMPGDREPVLLEPGTVTTIGRGQKATVHIDDTAASRVHAQITVQDDGRATLRDLQSANGTWLNGVEIQFEFLRHGDKIRIGSTTMRFEITETAMGGDTTKVEIEAMD